MQAYMHIHESMHFSFVHTYILAHIQIHILIGTYAHAHIHAYMVLYGQASGVPCTPLPTQWYGLVGVGRGEGAGVCREGSGPLGGGRPGVTQRAGILRKPYASHKPYSVGRVLAFICL